ncbi:MAG: DUF2723 domain-containing protein [bacterium]
MRTTDQKRKIYFFCAIFILSFVLFQCSSPSDVISGANTGELIAAGDTLGIAHPTGYPTWTSIAHFFTNAIPLADKAFRTSLFSVVTGCLTLVFTYAILISLFGDHWFILPVLTAFAVEPLFWAQCISVEVYGFHILLTTIFLFALVKNRKTADVRFALLAVFAIALALTNHLMSIFYLPLLSLIDSKHWTSIKHRRHFITTGVLLFILGLAPFLYLPIRAAGKPLFCWHNPSDFSGFIAHATGRQFHGLASGFSLEMLLSRLGSIPKEIQTPIQFLFWLIGIPGLILARKFFSGKVERNAVELFLIGIILFPLVYPIHDIDSYFLPLVWLLYITTSSILSRIKISGLNKNRFVGILTATVIAGLGIFFALPEIGLLKKTLLRSYGKIMLASVPGTCTFYYQGDTAMNSVALLAAVEHFTDDLTLVDRGQNLQPISFGRKRPAKDAVATSFRFFQEYPLFSPNGMAFISREFHYRSEAIVDLSQKLLLNPLMPKSRWNPYRNELQNLILLNLADNELEFGNWEDGIHYLEAAFEHATTIDFKRYIALTAAERGQIDLAIQMNQCILENAPKDRLALNAIASNHYLIGTDLEKAEDYAYRGVQITPPISDSLVMYYRILLARGKLDAAAKIEAQYPQFIDSSLTMQREILSRLADKIPIDVQTNLTPAQITEILDKLPLPALRHHYRLLMIKKLLDGAFTPQDFNTFAELSENMSYTNAALYLLTHYSDLYEADDYRDIVNQLQKKCFNLSLVTS